MAKPHRTAGELRQPAETRAKNPSEERDAIDPPEEEVIEPDDVDTEEGDEESSNAEADAEPGESGRSAGAMHVREMAFTGEAPNSINEKERTVDVVMSTGAAVKRSDWRDGDYMEVLDVKPKAIRTDRLNSGGPLLDSHNYWGGTRSILGAVVPGSVRVQGGTLRGKVKFSRSEVGERAFQDVKDGILRSVSVGYLTHKYETDDTTSPPTRRATDWEPYELSAVAMPADAAAGFRSAHRTHAAPAAPDASATSLARAAMRMKQRRAAV